MTFFAKCLKIIIKGKTFIPEARIEKVKEQKAKRQFSKITNIISWIFLGLVVLLAACVFIPMLFGAKLYTVRTGSMHPAYPVGTIVFVVPVDAEELEAGDVVTYHVTGGAVVTHRVVDNDRQGRRLRTKGDNNNTEDQAPVLYGDVIGRVKFGIPEVGKFFLFLGTRSGQIKAGIIIGAVIVIILICKLFFRSGDDEDDENNGGDGQTPGEAGDANS